MTTTFHSLFPGLLKSKSSLLFRYPCFIHISRSTWTACYGNLTYGFLLAEVLSWVFFKDGKKKKKAIFSKHCREVFLFFFLIIFWLYVCWVFCWVLCWIVRLISFLNYFFSSAAVCGCIFRTGLQQRIRNRCSPKQLLSHQSQTTLVCGNREAFLAEETYQLLLNRFQQ